MNEKGHSRLFPKTLQKFAKACQKAGKCGEQYFRQLLSSCLEPGTVEIDELAKASADTGDIKSKETGWSTIYPDTLPPPGNVLDELQNNIQRAIFLANNGCPTLASEHLEDTISMVMSSGTMYLNTLDPERLRSFFSLFSLWVSLPHKDSKKGRLAAREKLTYWLDFWSIEQFLVLAPEVLVQTLGSVCDQPVNEEIDVPAYDQWLDPMLYNGISDTQARSAIHSMVSGVCSSHPADKEKHYRTALLSGYSHPLPYLLLIELLAEKEDLHRARQIYDMYLLTVKNNSRWRQHENGYKPQSRHSVIRSFRTAETIRLETLFSDSLPRLGAKISAETKHLFSKSDLDSIWGYWPEEMRPAIGKLLFEKSLELLIFNLLTSEMVTYISEHFFPWSDAVALEQGIQNIDAYLDRILFSNNMLPLLHELKTQMLDALGRSPEAKHYIRNKLSSTKPATSDYSEFYCILAARELHGLGVIQSIPRYEHLRTLHLSNALNCPSQRLLVKELDDIMNQARVSSDKASLALRYTRLISRDNTDILPEGNSYTPTPSSRTARSTLTLPRGYIRYWTPDDGLCMYHALARISNLSTRALIEEMNKILIRISQKITQNIDTNLPWDNGLSQQEYNAAAPIVISSDGFNVDFLNESLLTLTAAVSLSHGQVISNQLDAWGDWTHFGLASVAMSNLGVPMSFTVELPVNLLAPGHFITYNSTGGYEAAENFPYHNNSPLIMHNGINHWFYALPESTLQPSWWRIYQNQMSPPLPKLFKKLVEFSLSNFNVTTHRQDQGELSPGVNLEVISEGIHNIFQGLENSAK